MADISIDTLKTDTKLFAAAFAFAKKEFNSEILLFYYEKADPKVLFEKYIAEGSPTQVNLPASIAEPMNTLAQANDWKNPAWEQHLKDARFNIGRLWNSDCKPRFLKSAEYRATPAGQKAAADAAAANAAKATSAVLAAQKAAAAAVKAQPAVPQKEEKPQNPAAGPKKADPKKAAKLLGITDPASIAKLTKAFDLSFKGDKSGALKLLTEFTKAEDRKLTDPIIKKLREEADF